MSDKTEPTGSGQDLTESWTTSATSSTSTTPVTTDDQSAVSEHPTLSTLDSTGRNIHSVGRCCDDGGSADLVKLEENRSTVVDYSIAEPSSHSAHWPTTTPVSTSAALDYAPWFRMASHSTRGDSLRDLHTFHSTDTYPGKWLFTSGVDAPVTLEEWSRSGEHVASNQFAPPPMSMMSSLTNKFGMYINPSNSVAYETVPRTKSPEQAHINLHHTLRDVIASTLDSAIQHENEQAKVREELTFQTTSKTESSASGFRLPQPQSRAPSLTVKIQMPLEDSTTYTNPDRTAPPLSNQLPDEGVSKHAHVKKPLNAFMLFMKEKRAQVMAECTLKESAAINQILGRKWHALSREEQAKYYGMARVEKERHQRMYPGWSARDNYACQVKRRKKRTSRDSLRYSTKPTGASVGTARQSLIPGASIQRITSSVSRPEMTEIVSTPEQSRFHRYTSVNNSIYPNMSQNYMTEQPWSVDPFKATTYSGTPNLNSNEPYLRSELPQSSVAHDRTHVGRHPTGEFGQSPVPESPTTCCPSIQERVNHFDAHMTKQSRKSYSSTFFGLDRSYEDCSATNLKLAFSEADRESPFAYNFTKGSREDSLMKFTVPFQTREPSLLHPPSTQWSSDPLTQLDAACARFGFSYSDRLGRTPCAPVPDLLQSTRGSDLTQRFPRPVSSPPNTTQCDAVSVPRMFNPQSDTSSFRSVTATVSAGTAAFTLKASSLVNSDVTPSCCYDARHYLPDTYVPPSQHAPSETTSGINLSPKMVGEHEFEVFEKKANYIPSMQNQDI